MANSSADSKDRAALIKGINSPLGFFVLALLIVESFLASVLILVDIDKEVKIIFIWMGCSLFLLLTIIVSALVWFKPANLTYDKDAHLLDRGKIPFGSDQQPINPEKRFGNQTEG